MISGVEEVVAEPEEETVKPAAEPKRSSIVIFAERAERIVRGLRVSRYEGANVAVSGNALHAAVACNSELLVDFHLSRGADPTAFNSSGETVIFVTLKKSNWQMLEKLVYALQ